MPQQPNQRPETKEWLSYYGETGQQPVRLRQA
ncbi:protein of unknown function [Thauera humireducens]|nr:protein of unknown function [Thauera humireducens]